MRLKWESHSTLGNTVLPQWVADGDSYSYGVTFLPLADKYLVRKMRQPGGQVVAETFALTLEGAHARAQTWEDGK